VRMPGLLGMTPIKIWQSENVFGIPFISPWKKRSTIGIGGPRFSDRLPVENLGP
jgi:hypothetical protein